LKYLSCAMPTISFNVVLGDNSISSPFSSALYSLIAPTSQDTVSFHFMPINYIFHKKWDNPGPEPRNRPESWGGGDVGNGEGYKCL
jgi:hypothetical protein